MSGIFNDMEGRMWQPAGHLLHHLCRAVVIRRAGDQTAGAGDPVLVLPLLKVTSVARTRRQADPGIDAMAAMASRRVLLSAAGPSTAGMASSASPCSRPCRAGRGAPQGSCHGNCHRGHQRPTQWRSTPARQHAAGGGWPFPARSCRQSTGRRNGTVDPQRIKTCTQPVAQAGEIMSASGVEAPYPGMFQDSTRRLFASPRICGMKLVASPPIP